MAQGEGRLKRLAGVCCALLLLFGATAAYAQKNQAPSATLTSPANGASFIAPASVSLAATASDPDGTVVRVDFYQGNTLIGTSNAAPYTATWSNVAAGSYSLTAKAVDNNGATGTSAPVSITVASATSLVITSPANGAAVSISSGLSVSGTYEGSTSGNTILVDDEAKSVLATISGNSYSASLAPGGLTVGNNTLTVRLNRADRTSVTRTITLPGYDNPVAAFTAPSTATFAAPASITFAVDAVAPGGTVSRVDFHMYSGSPLPPGIPLPPGSLIGSSANPPYQVTASDVSAGTYTLTAIAVSSHGVSGRANNTFQVLGPNALPSISITSPSPGATFTEPANIPISVSASDPDGWVTMVEYFSNEQLFHTSNVAPFGFTWSDVPQGTYALTARATDNRNGQTTSAPVNITASPPNIAPIVSLTSPPSGAVFTEPATVVMSADAADSDGTIVKVEFFQGSMLIATVTAPPYTFAWSNVAQGTYSLTARATDNRDAVTTSAPVSITVNPPPVVISSPGDGATVNGNSVLVRGTFIGAVNTGITVNGVLALTDGNNNFYAHNVPLSQGANTLTIKRTTDLGEAAGRSITVNSDGAASNVQITATPLSGIVPFTVTFTVNNGSPAQASVSLNGSPVMNVPAGNAGTFTLSFTSPVSYPATVSAEAQGTTTTKEFVIVAKNGAVVDQMFKGIWSNITTRLAVSNVEQAMIYFAPESRTRYQQVLSNIAPELSSMFSTPPVIHPTDLSAEDQAEYLTIVPRDGTNYGYRLYFMQGADGVWRLESL